VTRVQKLVPVGVLFVILLAVLFSLLPFKFAEGVSCEAPLMGGHPKSDTTVGLIIPKIDCPAKARSRLLVSAMISLAAAAAGTAIVALQPMSVQCFQGNHDGCPDWWANLLSQNDNGFGCQCDCHAGQAPVF
jgi:hypothetical protein